MSNYYNECLEKIENLIKNDQKKEALSLIEEELRMIYIPKEFEERIRELKKEVQPQNSKKQLSDEEIEDYFNKNETYQLLAVKELSQRNIRQYLDLVQEIFIKSKSTLVKISLIEVCVNQQVTDELTLYKDGFEITFIPSAINLPMDSDGVDCCTDYLKDWLESEDPTFYELCRQALLQEAYLHLPFEIEEEESESAAYAIVMYVSELMGCKEMMKKRLSEKNASQNDNFELLLYSNTI